MSENYILLLPFPPTVNSYYTLSQRGMYISKKGTCFAKKVEEAVHEQLPGVCIDYHVLLEVTLFPPDKRKRDLDNYMKALQDSLIKCGFLKDDSLINQLFIYRGEIVKEGLVKIEFSLAGPIIPARLSNTRSA